MDRKTRRKPKQRTVPPPSKCAAGDVVVRGYSEQKVERYTALASQAEAEGDYVLEQIYLNHAEHYRKEK